MQLVFPGNSKLFHLGWSPKRYTDIGLSNIDSTAMQFQSIAGCVTANFDISHTEHQYRC